MSNTACRRTLCTTVMFTLLVVWQYANALNSTYPSEAKFYFTDSSSTSYIVLIISRLGLANRLRSLADWYVIAEQSNRKLLVSWEPTLDCNALLSELIVSGSSSFTILPFYVQRGDVGIAFVEKLVKQENLSSLSFYEANKNSLFIDTDKCTPFILSKKVVVNDAKVVITNYDGLLSLEGTPCVQYLSQRSQFLRALVPVNEVQSMVDIILETYFKDVIMVGIHVRMFDPDEDWAVVPPLYGGSHLKQFGTGATTNHFSVVMHNIESKFWYTDALGQKKSSVRFYIASNSDEAKKELLAEFPSAVSVYGNYNRSSIDAIRFAFIEWLILSKAALVVNTYGSSFAEEAAQRYQRPLVGICDGRLIHTMSALLPFCGHITFAGYRSHSYALNAASGHYLSEINGITKNQTTAMVQMEQSSILAEWGLPIVLTTRWP